MVQGLRSQLLDAIRVRLRADVKVGVALSGGIDSSVIAGMVNHLIREGEQVGSDVITERLSCFGVAFDEDSGFDESCKSCNLPSKKNRILSGPQLRRMLPQIFSALNITRST